ncbi:MAG: hypothetical protein CVU47_06340 [Chloroflexi bacterium HGW-Chloroflexi-9]|nr:MAG: hypothetical protein CVU47_06340 [Chloroflexi bacterium HGW-Chloroflexi-9]
MPLEPANRDHVRIDLPAEGEWVNVKGALSRADEREIGIRTRARAEVLGLPVDGSSAVLRNEGALMVLSVVIRAWSYPEPITIESVRRLDDDSKNVIFARLADLYPPARTDDDRKNSPAPGVTPSESAAASLPSLAG